MVIILKKKKEIKIEVTRNRGNRRRVTKKMGTIENTEKQK